MRDELDPGEKNRTLETRLQFISKVFSKTYTKTEIFVSSVQFKLKKSYEQYIEDLDKSFTILGKKDPAIVLKNLK